MFQIIKKGGKKGQESIGISFNMLFSIFIIIVIISVAVYVIAKFLDTSKCANTGFFYEDLQDEIDKWRSGDSRSNYVYTGEIKSSGALKTGLSHVCFGNLSSPFSGNIVDRNIHNNLTRIFRNDHNVFMFPPEIVCEGLKSKKLEYVIIDNFFCVDAKYNNGKILIGLESDGGSPVKITKN